MIDSGVLQHNNIQADVTSQLTATTWKVAIWNTISIWLHPEAFFDVLISWLHHCFEGRCRQSGVYKRWGCGCREWRQFSFEHIFSKHKQTVMSSSSRAALRQKFEAHLGGPPNDQTRCVTDCKVWPKGVEPPYCCCQMRCVPNISREYETFGQRYWSCKNIEEVQKAVAISQVHRFF